MVDFQGTQRFRVVRRIGSGGMGVVYEAVDTASGATVALKTLRDLDGQAIYRLKNEFRALQGLQHPNLVHLGELVEDRGSWFFTMELVDGADFLQHVATHASGGEGAALAAADTLESVASTPRPFDEVRLRAALAQLVTALSALHEAGMVHRDVKPANIRVTPEGRLVLLDFGLVSERDEARQSFDNAVVGTVAYMAPEQAASLRVGPPADWYAVGTVLYEALTGRLPFAGAVLDVLMSKQRAEPPPPRVLVPDVPRDLDALCSELLRFDRRRVRRAPSCSLASASASPSRPRWPRARRAAAARPCSVASTPWTRSPRRSPPRAPVARSRCA